MDLTAQKNINNSKELVNNSHYCFFERFALRPFPLKISFKQIVYSYKGKGRNIENPSKTAVSSFGYLPSSSELSRFIYRWVNTSISYKLFWGGEPSYISYLGDDMGGCYIIESSYRFEDFNLRGGRGFAFFNENFFYFGEFSFKEDKSSDFGFKYFLMDRGFNTDRICQVRDYISKGEGLFSTSFTLDDWEEFFFCSGESFSGWEIKEEFKGGVCKWVYKFKDFRKEEMDESFDFVFEGSALLDDAFSFSCKASQICRVILEGDEVMVIQSQEVGNSGRVFFIGFCFSQGEMGEVRDEEGVYEDRRDLMGAEEGKEIDIIRTCGLHTHKDLVDGVTISDKGRKKGGEAGGGDRETGREERSSIFSYDGCEERIFRYIDTTEKIKHFLNLHLVYEAGASQSILHSDKGSQTQSTYKDNERQVTDSHKGSKTQEKWSSPASSSLSYQVINRSINNINYS